jgi:hypothetical protein
MLFLGVGMLKKEGLCLSTQCVFFLRLKLKRGLNVLLPAHVGLGHLAFEYSFRVFLEAQTVCCFFVVGVLVCSCVVLVDRKTYYDSRFTICLGKGEDYGYEEISDTHVDGGCGGSGRRGGFGVGCSGHEQNGQ